MSLADQASLLFIPSGYKSQKVYSIFPTDGDGDFDFSRSGSATRIAKNGLITTVDSNVPRLEYPLIDGVVNGCPSLLLEPERTNLIAYSEDFNQWAQTRSSVSTNNLISPDGTLSADKISETSDSGLHAISQNLTVASGVSHTVSVFIKKGTNEFVQILFGTNNVIGNPYVNFDVNQGVFENNGTTSADIEYFGNEWYRCSTTVTTASTTFTYFISSIKSISDSRASSFTGNVNNNIYIFGAQLEQGSYATSYIPTNGASATRQAETANGSGDASTFNSSEGVLMAEISALTDEGSYRLISLSDGTLNQRITILYDIIDNKIYGQCVNSTTQAFIPFVPPSISNTNKILFKYKANNFELWVNGFEVGTDTSGVVPSGLNKLSFDRGDGIAPFYGNTKQVQYYNTALTDSELEKISSWTSFSDMAQAQQYSII